MANPNFEPDPDPDPHLILTLTPTSLDSCRETLIRHSGGGTVVLEKTPEGPLDSKKIKPVNPKGN